MARVPARKLERSLFARLHVQVHFVPCAPARADDEPPASAEEAASLSYGNPNNCANTTAMASITIHRHASTSLYFCVNMLQL